MLTLNILALGGTVASDVYKSKRGQWDSSSFYLQVEGYLNKNSDKTYKLSIKVDSFGIANVKKGDFVIVEGRLVEFQSKDQATGVTTKHFILSADRISSADGRTVKPAPFGRETVSVDNPVSDVSFLDEY